MSKRESIRLPVRLSASCKFGNNLSQNVVLVDLSEAGCRLENAPRILLRGELITLSFDEFEFIEGKVRWLTKGGAAGIQFAEPIYQADYHALRRASELITLTHVPVQKELNMPEGSPFASGRQDTWRSQETTTFKDTYRTSAEEPIAPPPTSGFCDGAKLPVEDLARFVKLVEAAKSCGFSSLDVDLTSNGLSVRLSSLASCPDNRHHLRMQS